MQRSNSNLNSIFIYIFFQFICFSFYNKKIHFDFNIYYQLDILSEKNNNFHELIKLKNNPNELEKLKNRAKLLKQENNRMKKKLFNKYESDLISNKKLRLELSKGKYSESILQNRSGSFSPKKK